MATLRDLREKNNLTQEEVARKLGISVSYYSLLENGKRRISLDIARGISQVLRCSLDDVFCAYKVCRTSTKEASADATA